MRYVTGTSFGNEFNATIKRMSTMLTIHKSLSEHVYGDFNFSVFDSFPDGYVSVVVRKEHDGSTLTESSASKVANQIFNVFGKEYHGFAGNDEKIGRTFSVDDGLLYRDTYAADKALKFLLKIEGTIVEFTIYEVDVTDVELVWSSNGYWTIVPIDVRQMDLPYEETQDVPE